MDAPELAPKVLFNDMLEAIESNRLPLPTQPDIAMQIQEITSNPNVTIEELNDVLKKDPGLTARIMRIANSPLVRGQVIITTLKTALSRLGTQFVANMAIGLAMEQLLNATNPIIDEKMKEEWSKSGEVASISFVLANYTKACQPEEALLAGLLQNIGALPMYTFADKHPKILKDLEAFNWFIYKYAPKLGSSILTSWQFPITLSAMPKNMQEYARVVPNADIADVVLLAKIHVMHQHDHPIAKLDPAEITAYERLKIPPKLNLCEVPELEPLLAHVKNVFA